MTTCPPFSQITHQLVNALASIPIDEDNLITKATYLLTALLYKQRQCLPAPSLYRIIDWLLRAIRKHRAIGLCDTLRAVQALIKANTATELSGDLKPSLLALLFALIDDPTHLSHRSAAANYECCDPKDVRIASILCLETLLAVHPMTMDESKAKQLLITLLPVLYSSDMDELMYTAALNIFRLLIASHRNVCLDNIGDLLGIAKCFMTYGIGMCGSTQPVRVTVSQQAISEPQASEPATSKGGKVAKSRKTKPRTPKSVAVKPTLDPPTDFSLTTTMSLMTSDSDFSESETSRKRHDGQKKSKLRLAALALIGVLGQVVETRTLFGYWHSLFPTECATTAASNSLLQCALTDPNPRCRIAALQATAAWLHGSRWFLTRAENSDRPPASYRPFSLALGDMIIQMYETLTKAVRLESSLSVLQQVLKCLVALIQVTTFRKLKCDFVATIVAETRKLLYHKGNLIINLIKYLS